MQRDWSAPSRKLTHAFRGLTTGSGGCKTPLKVLRMRNVLVVTLAIGALSVVPASAQRQTPPAPSTQAPSTPGTPPAGAPPAAPGSATPATPGQTPGRGGGQGVGSQGDPDPGV